VDALSEWLVGSSACLIAEYPGWRLVWGSAEGKQNKRVHVHATAHRPMSRVFGGYTWPLYDEQAKHYMCVNIVIFMHLNCWCFTLFCMFTLWQMRMV